MAFRQKGAKMMADKIRIVKKNDEYNSEYEVGDVFEVTPLQY